MLNCLKTAQDNEPVSGLESLGGRRSSKLTGASADPNYSHVVPLAESKLGQGAPNQVRALSQADFYHIEAIYSLM